MDKHEIRIAMRAAKKAVPFYSKRELSEQALTRVEAMRQFAEAKTVLLYWSLPDELHTHDFALRWVGSKEILLPCVEGDILLLRRFEGIETMRKDPQFGIDEPQGTVFKSVGDVDFVLVPGVAFDRHCNRLGRGKGYYDKLLPSLPNAYKVGACFDFQLLPLVPSDVHDVKMDAIVTNRELIIR